MSLSRQAFRVASARRSEEIVRAEAVRLQGILGSTFRGNKVRAVMAVTRRILLLGPFIFNGRLLTPKTRSIGAGVWEIWVEETE